MLWELAAAPKNTLFTHPRPSTTDEPHMNNCPHGLDGCEVRLCDPCARVPCVSRLPPRPRGLPRCLFTGTRSPGCPLCHLTGSTVPIQYSTGKKTPGGAGTQAHNTFQYTVITQLHTHVGAHRSHRRTTPVATMVVRFVCVIRVSVCLVCPVCIPAPPGVFERYTEATVHAEGRTKCRNRP